MEFIEYKKMYKKISKILGELTPLKVDCGVLCESACCKGEDNLGMLLFPHEESGLNIVNTEFGGRLAVCNGTCNREERPLACRIFPFFPTVDMNGKVFVEKDNRAQRLCPLLSHSDEIIFNPKFFRALKKVGKILAKDKECLEFLRQVTEEIDTYNEFLR